jgi:hypothetical protein
LARSSQPRVAPRLGSHRGIPPYPFGHFKPTLEHRCREADLEMENQLGGPP